MLLITSNSNILRYLETTPRNPRSRAVIRVVSPEPFKGMEKETHQYETGSWRNDDSTLPREAYLLSQFHEVDTVDRDVRDRSRLLLLLGLINYKILTGKRVYIEVGGIVYRTLYGGYWRSVFTGVEHYLLRCQQISGGMWTEGGTSVGTIDLPILHTKEGWTAKGHSLMFMLHRD